MRKGIITLFMAFILLLSFQTVIFAESEFEYKVSGGTVGIAEYKGHSEKVEIPSETDDNEVTAILSGAFKGNEDLKSIVIPESIVEIAENAFESCIELKDIYYGGTAENWDKVNVSEKGNESFIEATLHFAESNGDVLEKESFRYSINADNEIIVTECRAKYAENTKITFPSRIDDRKVIRISDNAFENCRNITEITLEEGIKYIGARAFSGCIELKKASLPNSLERIGTNVFTNTEIYKSSPDGSIYIDGWYCGYKGDTSKERDIRIQRNTKGIADFAFYQNEDVENVFFTKGIKYIGSGAFGECNRLSGIFFEGTKKDWSEIVISSGNESLSESKMRYNMTIDSYVADEYKGLCTMLLIVTGILLAVLVYCFSKITVQKQVIAQFEKRENEKSAEQKTPVTSKKTSVSNKKTVPPKESSVTNRKK